MRSNSSRLLGRFYFDSNGGSRLIIATSSRVYGDCSPLPSVNSSCYLARARRIFTEYSGRHRWVRSYGGVFNGQAWILGCWSWGELNSFIISVMLFLPSRLVLAWYLIWISAVGRIIISIVVCQSVVLRCFVMEWPGNFRDFALCGIK